MAKILSFDSGQFVKYPLFNRFKDWWDIQDKFIKLTLVTIVLLAISTPVIVTSYLTLRQEASDGNRKVFIGMADAISQGPIGGGHQNDLTYVTADVENIKNLTGVYPAVYSIFINVDTPVVNLELLRYLDSKGIAPVINLLPVGSPMERRDGRFKLSSDTTDPVSNLVAQEVRFNSLVPSAITKIWVSKTYFDTPDKRVSGGLKELVKTWEPGSTFSMIGSKENENADYENSNKFEFVVVNKVEKANFWEIEVSVKRQGSFDGVFSAAKPVFLTMADTYGKEWGNQRISEGSLDDKFKQFGEVAKQFGKPILLRYAFEMNGDWFPWSAGARDHRVPPYKTLRYFDMNNTEANYKSAWRHVYKVIKGDPNQVNAQNVYFFWCATDKSSSEGYLRQYFPGDDFVDFVGFDVYSGIGGSNHASVQTLIDAPMRRLMNISSKNLVIGEMGINSDNKQIPADQFPDYRRRWLLEGYSYLYEAFPRMRGIIYFNLDVRDVERNNNWLISNGFSHKPSPDAIPEVLTQYKTLLADPRFQGKLTPGQANGGPDTPTVTIAPNPSSGLSPVGFHDVSTCVVSGGWACDKDNYSQALNIEFYADNPKGSGGVYLGNTNANLVREQAVGAQCGGNRSHGFNFATPATLSDGKPHKIYAYATNIGEGKTRILNNSPKTITCGNVGQLGTYTANLLPLEDSYTASGHPTQNYGRSIYLKADASPLNVTYLKFDTTTYKTKKIKKAIIELTVSTLEDAKSALGKGLDARVVSSSWKDITITHNSHPLYGNVIQTHTGAVVTGNKVTLDITDYIKSNLGVVSLALVNKGSDGVVFNSIEATANKPKLIITYEN